MDWIKRNLIFVIGAVVALVFLGAAGWYSWSGYSNNAGQKEQINVQYEELKRLTQLKPNPGDGRKVDNIKLAQEQEKEAVAFTAKLTDRLKPIAALPEGTNLVASEYSAALQRTIDELQREATNNSVVLPPKYKFSFDAQAGRVTFAAGSLERLATQLGEVRAICGILNEAKVNSLDSVRRERVSEDDKSGPATDYLDLASVTNDLAVSTPYEVTFRCFTPELASVLAGFANSPYGLIVKAVNIEPAGVVVATDSMETPAPSGPILMPLPDQPVLQRKSAEGDAFRNRYGRNMSPRPMPAPSPVPVPIPVTGVAPGRSGLQTILAEKQLKVTLLIHVVKLQPKT